MWKGTLLMISFAGLGDGVVPTGVEVGVGSTVGVGLATGVGEGLTSGEFVAIWLG
jgi:hypothetical protein